MKLKLPPEIREIFAKAGKKGGRSTSDDKATASRQNGKLGGRPKKKAK